MGRILSQNRRRITSKRIKFLLHEIIPIFFTIFLVLILEWVLIPLIVNQSTGMFGFIFHYIREPGGTLSFTKQGIRYSVKDGKEYIWKKEIADHLNSLSYPDRDLNRGPNERIATLKIVGKIPRCTATILETFEKEYDPKTDIPDQTFWRNKAMQIA